MSTGIIVAIVVVIVLIVGLFAVLPAMRRRSLERKREKELLARP